MKLNDEDEQENCEITNEPCPVCFDYPFCGDECPIERYEEGSYYYSQKEIEKQIKEHPDRIPAAFVLTEICRHYGFWADRVKGKKLRRRND